MSYFDGMIPTACAGCFHWDGEKWVHTAPGLCDECEYMLDMFPVLEPNGGIAGEKLALLATLPPPEWSSAQKTR